MSTTAGSTGSGSPSTVTEIVREKYGDAARRVLDTGNAASCCGPDCCA